MVLILRPAVAGEQLPDEDGPCPACGGVLAPWGYARARSVRDVLGTRVVRPRRVRCRDCRGTHVLLPAMFLPRRADTIEVVGAALLAAATGASHRSIAAGLDRPADTVRGWIRAATSQAVSLREHAARLAHRLDPVQPPIEPTGTLLADAVEALGCAVMASARRLGKRGHPWELVNWLTSGRLLNPTGRAG